MPTVNLQDFYTQAEAQMFAMVNAFVEHNLESAFNRFRQTPHGDKWHDTLEDMLVYQQWRTANTEKKKAVIKELENEMISRWAGIIVLVCTGKPMDEVLADI